MSEELILNPEDRVLFIINDNLIHGSTRFQKYGFLLYKQYSKELEKLENTFSEFDFYDDWTPYYYGPYSKTLEKNIQTAIDLKLLNRIEDRNEHSKKTTHLYSLTLRGRIRWRKFLSDAPKEMKIINEKIRELQHKDFYVLLRQIYDAYPDYTINSKIKDKLNLL